MLFLLYFLMLAILVPSGAVHAYRHHTSKIRYHEYSSAVFDQARQEGRPVFMNISAVWCYWCKYFDEHTLETEEVASYLKRHYLSIFVDSDARMDLTRKYARGWPMTVLFDPEGRVRLAFPGALRKNDFMDLLRRVEGEVRSGKEVAESSSPKSSSAPPSQVLGTDHYRRLVEGMVRYFDEQVDPLHGGFGQERKFPHGRFLAFLLELEEVTRDRGRSALLEKTLAAIQRGIFDPLEGGFYRYAERRDWTEPHTEKMLYVNAALATVFQKASQVFNRSSYARIDEATTAYLLRTLYDPKSGGFYGSQSAGPNYYRLSPADRNAAQKPLVNRDKLTAWNAEAILALFRAVQSKKRRDLNEAALHSLDFMQKHLLTDRGVYHIYRGHTGKGFLLGQLEANAWASLVFLEGYRQSKRPQYMQAAEKILSYLQAELYDQKRGVFVEQKNLDVRQVPAGALEIPLDANGLIAEAYLLAFSLSGRRAYRAMGQTVLKALSGEIALLLSEAGDNVSPRSVVDAVFYLKAYRTMLGRS